MDYDEFIESIKKTLEITLTIVPEHNLDQKYIASACRDYAEALRALEQAKHTSRREY